MKSHQNPEFHETDESVDSKKTEKDFRLFFSKMLFRNLIYCSYEDFKFTRGKFSEPDLTYAYVDDFGLEKVSSMILEYCSKETKLSYRDLAEDGNNFFYLPRCFESYCRAQEAIDTDKDFEGASLGELILCTNIGFENDLKGMEISRQEATEMLKGTGTSYKINISQFDKRNIFADKYITKSKKLANELTNYIITNKAIKIESLKDSGLGLVKDYHIALGKHVLNLSTKKFKTEFLEGSFPKNSDIQNFREDFFESLRVCLDQAKKQIENKEVGNIKRLKFLKKQLDDNKTSKSVKSFLQAVKLNASPSFGDATLYPNDFQALPNEFVVAEKVDWEIDNFMNHLVYLAEVSIDDSQIHKKMRPDCSIAFSNEMKEWFHHGCNRNKRRWITKEKLLNKAMATRITFQGKEMLLSKIIHDEKQLDPDTLIRVFCSKKISIGKPITNSSNKKEYYVSRVLRRNRRIDINVLKSDSDDVFIISVINADDSIHTYIPNSHNVEHLDGHKDHSRFVLVMDSFQEIDFEKFVSENKNKFSGKNIHFVSHDEEGLLWHDTFGSLKNLRPHFRAFNEKDEYIKENDIQDRFVVIVGEPGMGKSALIDNIHRTLSQLKTLKFKWVIKISPEDCLQLIDKTENFRELTNIVEFLATLEHSKDKLSKTLLEHFINHEGHLIILFDGFCYLHSVVQQEKVIDFLQFLKFQSKVAQIFITTRPQFKEKLEDSFGVVSFSMTELSETEQVTYLSKYWSQNSSEAQSEILKSAKVIVSQFRNLLPNQKRSLLSIPHHIRACAARHLKGVINGHCCDSQSLPEVSIIKDFINKKYSIYLKNTKEEKDDEEVENGEKEDIFYKLLDGVHQDFSFLYSDIFSSSEAELFVQMNNTFEDEELLDVGILYKQNGTFHFIHESFSAFLIANRLVETSLNRHKYKGEQVNLLRRSILKPENKFLLYLFDIKMTEFFPQHHAVMQGDQEKIKAFEEKEIQSKDAIGRSLLYYGIKYGNYESIQLLIDKVASLDFKGEFTKNALASHINDYYQVNRNDYDREKLAQLDKKHETFVQSVFEKQNQGCSEIIEAFDLEREIQYKNWKSVEILILHGSKITSITTLRSALMEKAPLSLTMNILTALTQTRFGGLKEDIVSLASFEDAQILLEVVKEVARLGRGTSHSPKVEKKCV